MKYQPHRNSEGMNSGFYIILIDGQKEELNSANYLKMITGLRSRERFKILHQPVLNKHLAKNDSASDYGIWVPNDYNLEEFTDIIDDIPYNYKIIQFGGTNKKEEPVF